MHSRVHRVSASRLLALHPVRLVNGHDRSQDRSVNGRSRCTLPVVAGHRTSLDGCSSRRVRRASAHRSTASRTHPFPHMRPCAASSQATATPGLTDSTDYVVSLLRARDARTPHGRFRHDPTNPSVPVGGMAACSHRVIRRICARVVGAAAVAARVSEEDALRGVQQIGVLCRIIPARSGQRREQSHRPRGKRGPSSAFRNAGGTSAAFA